MLELSELEHDAMLEVINIGMGYAADTLSNLVNDEVNLAIPSFEPLDNQEAIKKMEAFAGNARICAISQHIESMTGSDFRADVSLIFAEQPALQLLQVVIGNDNEHTLPTGELSEMQQEAITEVGNIVLNACIGAMSNVLNTEFSISLPFYRLTSYYDLLGGSELENNSNNVIILLLINFELSTSKVQGYMTLKMDLPAFEDFKRHIMQLIDSYGS